MQAAECKYIFLLVFEYTYFVYVISVVLLRYCCIIVALYRRAKRRV